MQSDEAGAAGYRRERSSARCVRTSQRRQM